jgi:ATP-dependent Clp protease ATP-binding subunit ClpA
VFERFTERAREVVVLAQDEARVLKHNYIGTEHLLLGLLREEEGLAARVLESLDVTLEEVRNQVARIVGTGDEPFVTGQVPFTPRAKKVLELSLREAMALGHNYIGTEHVLLGIARENEGVAARILLDFDVDDEKIRTEVIRMLSGPGTSRKAPPRPGPRGIAPEIERLRALKDAAIEKGQFERAAQLRDRERKLVSEEAREAEGLRPRSYEEFWRSRRVSLVPGWFLFGVSLGIGVLIGWAIWGV